MENKTVMNDPFKDYKMFNTEEEYLASPEYIQDRREMQELLERIDRGEEKCYTIEEAKEIMDKWFENLKKN